MQRFLGPYKRNITQGCAIVVLTATACVVFAPSPRVEAWRSRGEYRSIDPKPSPNLSISLVGDNPLQHECGEPFEDPGATAHNRAGESVAVEVSGTVEVQALGTYTLTYTATEGGNSVSIERAVVVTDTTPPEISLRGSNPMGLACGTTFEDPGSSAIDRCDREVPVLITGTVDSQVLGEYAITYAATDSHGNRKTVVRRVLVGSSEEQPPTISLNGESSMTVECGQEFVDPGATAATACSGAVYVEPSGVVDTRNPETYVVIYKAAAGESKSEKVRTVDVVDTIPPVILLEGPNPLVIELNQHFVDPGAIALDGCAGRFAATAAGTVDTKTVGTYTITYSARDRSGNEAVPVTRTVKVAAKTNPESLSFLRLLSLPRESSLEIMFRTLPALSLF